VATDRCIWTLTLTSLGCLGARGSVGVPGGDAGDDDVADVAGDLDGEVTLLCLIRRAMSADVDRTIVLLLLLV
jgi:hypothetical protein